MMATSLHDKMKSAGSKRRKKIEARSAELIAEEMALRELRKAHHRTQTSMAKQLGIRNVLDIGFTLGDGFCL
jgi:hypothetical protein